MSELTAQAWCRACGSAHHAVDQCDACGAPMDRPAPGPTRIGRVVDTGARLRTVLGIALSQTGGTVAMAVKGEQPVLLPAAEFDRLRPVAVAGTPVNGSAGRLWAALDAMVQGRLRAKWPAEALDAAAWQQALVTVGTRRGAALDRIALGHVDCLDRLGLGTAEPAWYVACRVGEVGDTGTLLAWLEHLPREGYHGRAALLLARAEDLLRDPELARRATAQLTAFAAADPDAAALLAALSPTPPDRIVETLAGYLEQAADPAGAEIGEVAALGPLVVGLTPEGGPVPGGHLPATRALALFLAGRQGAVLDGEAGALARLPVALLDQLVDAGALTKAADHRVWPQPEAAYLRCRTDPGGASPDELRQAGFTAELARRAFLAGDPAALAALPAQDPDLRHYQALASWTDRSGGCATDGLRPAARTALELVARLRDRIVETGSPEELPDLLAADPTCWPLLRPQAAAGNLLLGDEVRQARPECAQWLDLCRLEQLVYTADWPEAALLGRALATRAGRAEVADEARSMAALAEFQLGRAAAAADVLAPALGEHCATALLINAAALAGDQGSEPALPYLARIAARDQDDRMRRAAVGHAVELWLQDAGAPTYPEPLRDIVRGALARPADDLLHAGLLRLAYNQDGDWLSGAGGDTVLTDGPGQAQALDYWRTKARSQVPDRPETLADVAGLLGRLAATGERPGWMQAELTWLIDFFDEGVHRAFGEAEAMLCVPAIQAILPTGALPAVPQYFLAVQAGAHLAVYRDDHGSVLDAAVERELLFDPCSAFLRGRPAVEEPRRAYVASELDRCMTVASRALASATDRAFDRATPEWSRLVQLKRSEPRENYSYQRMLGEKQSELLDGLDAMIARLRTFHHHLGDLPTNEQSDREWRQSLAELVLGWSAETTRLRKFI
jgi:hypothetical protein